MLLCNMRKMEEFWEVHIAFINDTVIRISKRSRLSVLLPSHRKSVRVTKKTLNSLNFILWRVLKVQRLV